MPKITTYICNHCGSTTAFVTITHFVSTNKPVQRELYLCDECLGKIDTWGDDKIAEEASDG